MNRAACLPRFRALIFCVRFMLVAAMLGGGSLGSASVVDVVVGVSPPPGPPFITITQQPAGQAVIAGQSASYAVVATTGGVNPLVFQWQRAAAGSDTFATLTNGGGIGGATTATLSVASTSVAMSGARFRVLLHNTTFSLLSNAATLSVSKAAATLTLSGLTQIFSGTARTVSVSTNPKGMTVSTT